MADLFSSLFPGMTGNTGTGNMDLFQSGLYPQSYSGVSPQYSDQAMPQIIQQLQSSLSSMPTSINNFTRTGAYSTLQDVMNNLAGRGMMNSSVASDALAKGITGMGNQAAQMQYQSPQVLGSLANNLGNFSYSSNQLAPYELLSNFVLNY